MTVQTAITAAAAQQEKPWENLFGVCAAIGEDLGFNPLWLRIALGVGVLFNPVAVAVTYAWLALAVLVSRVIFPKRKAQPTASVAVLPTSPAASKPHAEVAPELPLAA